MTKKPQSLLQNIPWLNPKSSCRACFVKAHVLLIMIRQSDGDDKTLRVFVGALR